MDLPNLEDQFVEHLTTAHNWQDCLPSSTYYNATDFRQHIEKVHRGTMGEWIKRLENNCKKWTGTIDAKAHPFIPPCSEIAGSKNAQMRC